MAVFAWGAVFYGHSVYLDALQQTRGWSASLISSAILVFWFSTIPGTLFVGSLVDRRGAAPVLAFGAVTVGSGVVLLGQVAAPWQLFVVYGLMGIGYPALGTAGISAALAPWFERRFGLALGLALTGASLGGAVLPPLLVAVSADAGFATATAMVGAAMLALLLPAAALLAWCAGDGTGRRKPAAATVPPHATVAATLLRRPLFWRIAIGGALGLGAQVGFLAHQVPMLAPALGSNGAALSVTVVALSAAAGRLVVGFLSRRIDEAWLTVACYLAQAIGFFVLLQGNSVGVLYLGCAIAGFVVGAIVMLPPMLVRRAFGSDGFGRSYALVNVVLYVGAGLGPWLAGLLRDLSGGYAAALWLLAGMHLFGAAVLARRAR